MKEANAEADSHRNSSVVMAPRVTLILFLYCTWYSSIVTAFSSSCRSPTGRCILHSSFSNTSKHATISSPSSKQWTGGYVPIHPESGDDKEVLELIQGSVDQEHTLHTQSATLEPEPLLNHPEVKTVTTDPVHIHVILPERDHTLDSSPMTHSTSHMDMASLSSRAEIQPTFQVHEYSPPSPDSQGPRIGFEHSCVLTEEQVAPIFKFQKKSNGKIKVLNAFSLYTILICVLTMPLWALSMYLVDALNRTFPDWDPHRANFDKTGKIWCKIYLTMTNSYPTISGDLQRLKERVGTSQENSSCLFVANHASFLDIAVLCTVLDPVFKFIAKSDLKTFPFIGQQLTGGQHILIDRNDRRSQLRAFKEGVSWLQKGVPLTAFPEGTRSKDGRLIDFKGGMFSMAVKSKVPIVPISISNTHAIFPSNALMPIQMGTGKLHVHVHPPIYVEGKSEEELATLVRTALLSKLPFDQQPLQGHDRVPSDDDDDDD
jgi:1-acyl-sn-glycerol-3-phosphate acyltransferase